MAHPADGPFPAWASAAPVGRCIEQVRPKATPACLAHLRVGEGSPANKYSPKCLPSQTIGASPSALPETVVARVPNGLTVRADLCLDSGVGAAALA